MLRLCRRFFIKGAKVWRDQLGVHGLRRHTRSRDDLRESVPDLGIKLLEVTGCTTLRLVKYGGYPAKTGAFKGSALEDPRFQPRQIRVLKRLLNYLLDFRPNSVEARLTTIRYGIVRLALFPACTT